MKSTLKGLVLALVAPFCFAGDFRANAQSVTWNPITGEVSSSVPINGIGTINISNKKPVYTDVAVTQTPTTIPPTVPPTAPVVTPQPNPTKVAFTKANLQNLGGIAFNLDDATGSSFKNGLPVFDKAGIKTTIAVIGLGNTQYDYGSGYYASDAMIKAASKSGHLIASHGMHHLDSTKLAPAKLEFELKSSKVMLQRLIGLQVNSFIAPYCAMNPEVLKVVKKYYTSVSVCGGAGNATASFNPYAIDRKMVESSTTIQEVQSWIQEAKASKKFLVLTLHHVGALEKDDQNISVEMLQNIVNLAKNSGMPLGTTEAAVKLLK